MPAHIRLSSLDAERPAQPLAEWSTDSDDDGLDNIDENIEDDESSSWQRDRKGKRPAWLTPNKKSSWGLRSLSLTQYLLIACAISFLLSAAFFSQSRSRSGSSINDPIKGGGGRQDEKGDENDDPDPDYAEKFLNRTRTSHPIDKLMDDALEQHRIQLSQRSHDLRTAASRYRERRGRHPPPGFDAWFAYATAHSSVVVESFFDRIYSDLSPFWGLASTLDQEDEQQKYYLARRAASWHHMMRIRNGEAFAVGKQEIWLDHWTNLIKGEMASHLPDLDMPINFMDESRLLVPFEKISNYTSAGLAAFRDISPVPETISTFTPLSDYVDDSLLPYDPEWSKETPPNFHGEGSFWEYTRQTCPPDSPSRDSPRLEDMEAGYPDELILPGQGEGYQYKGFISNMTSSRDPCIQPHLRGMHATFIEPISMSVSQELIPLFGGSKLPRNNEILLPGAMYLTDDPYYSGDDDKTGGGGSVYAKENQIPWWRKKEGAVWRGVASGGRHKKENWRRFQRMRLMEMMNGTTISSVEGGVRGRPETFALPEGEGGWGQGGDDDDGWSEDFEERHGGHIGEWLSSEQGEGEGGEKYQFSDAGFIHMMCFPVESNCDYVIPEHMDKVPPITMKEMYQRKLLPDVDGNSFSGRFRGFLRSTSLPLKATVYTEWHDDRLQPWLHYAPLDNTLMDLYPVLDFFSKDEEGDRAARWIAYSGMEWSEEVLRREDMLLYVWRLLLEWARVCDPNREVLGFVGDLEEEEMRN